MPMSPTPQDLKRKKIQMIKISWVVERFDLKRILQQDNSGRYSRIHFHTYYMFRPYGSMTVTAVTYIFGSSNHASYSALNFDLEFME